MPLIRRTPDVAPDPAPAAAELFGALNDRASDVRSAAARRLASSPGGPEALGVALGRETDDRVREAIFTSLTLADSAAAVEALSPHLRSDDAGLRRGTLDALRAMSLTARPYLPTLLADPDADVRLLACEVVRELPSTDATPLICALLERETELNVCASAVDVVAEIGSPAALPALTVCAARFADDPFLTFAIGVARKRIGAADVRRD